jgi:multidrug transporter EmrE-like cation transporter
VFKNIFINLLCAGLVVGATSLLKLALVNKGFSWKGSLTTLGRDLLQLFSLPLIWAGILLFILANILWLMILATQKLGIAYPLQIALVFLLSTMTSILLFGEKPSVISVAGLVLVVSGVILITRG